MRVFGSVLLFGGFFLCLSIDWLPIGFFAMGIGLIFLLMSDDRYYSSGKLREHPSAKQDKVRSRARAGLSANFKRGKIKSERGQWRRLVQNDPELAEVERILFQYGPKYADQLARAYVVFNNKVFLGTILDMVVASAKSNIEWAPLKPNAVGYFPIGQSSGHALDRSVSEDPQPLQADHFAQPAQPQPPPPRAQPEDAICIPPEVVQDREADALKRLLKTIERGSKSG